MTTAEDVARWLIAQIRSNGSKLSYQRLLVDQIRQKFGEEWSYRNANGNWAIDGAVLREFGKLKDELVVWDRSNQSWRVVTTEQLADIRTRAAARKQRREEAAALRARLREERGEVGGAGRR